MDSDDDEVVKAQPAVSLSEVLEDERYNGKTRLVCDYDMNRGEHEIILLGPADATLGLRMDIKQRVFCVAGDGHGDAGDCGS